MYIAFYRILICYAKEDILRYILWSPLVFEPASHQRYKVYLLHTAKPPQPPQPPPWWRQIMDEGTLKTPTP